MSLLWKTKELSFAPFWQKKSKPKPNKTKELCHKVLFCCCSEQQQCVKQREREISHFEGEAEL